MFDHKQSTSYNDAIKISYVITDDKIIYDDGVSFKMEDGCIVIDDGVEEFMERIGLDYSIDKWFSEIAGAHETMKNVKTFLDTNKTLFDVFNNCHQMKKMIGISNVTFKLNPAERRHVQDAINSQDLFTIMPHLIERNFHCKLVRDLILVIGTKCNITSHNLLLIAFAGNAHDLGQSVFSHDGDDYLGYYGIADHEERGNMIIRNLECIKGFLSHEDIETVINIVNNEHPFGEILSIADTLTYLRHDIKAFGLKPIDELFTRVIDSITGFDGQHVILSDEGPMLEMLKLRFEMYRTIYCALSNKIRHAAIVNVFDFLRNIDREIIKSIKEAYDHPFGFSLDHPLTFNDLTDECTDIEIITTIQNFANNPNKHQLLIKILHDIIFFAQDVENSPRWMPIYLPKESFDTMFPECGKNIVKIRDTVIEQTNPETIHRELMKLFIFPVVPSKLGKSYKAMIDSKIQILEYHETVEEPCHNMYGIYIPKIFWEDVKCFFNQTNTNRV